MSTFLAIVQIVSMLIPMVTPLVKSVETAFSGVAGSGSGKLSAVENILKSAFDHIGQAAVTWEQVWPSLQGFVNATVAIYNAAGIFTHASTAVNTVASDITQVGNAVSTVAQEIAPAPTPAPVVVPITQAPVASDTPSPFSSALASASASSPPAPVNS